MLKANSGDWVRDDEGINELILEHFSDLYEHSGPRDFSNILSVVDNVISEGMNLSLIRDVSKDEIKRAAFELGSLKSPGPDGYPGFFFQSFWDKVGNEVCGAVKRFFSNGFFLRKLNNTNITLIPKVFCPKALGQFRPISLCNFAMKVITKVMANRLKSILQEIISPNHSAFFLGHLIQDNIIVAHEVFHFLKMKKGTGGFMALKLDFNKAYDGVEWDFVEALMNKMGFHATWVNWVMQCISNVKFTIMVNGKARVQVRPKRGLRQGDPLSPYLFVLVKDVLSKMISKACEEKQLSGARFNRNCPTLSHSFFADDALLFSKLKYRTVK